MTETLCAVLGVCVCKANRGEIQNPNYNALLFSTLLNRRAISHSPYAKEAFASIVLVGFQVVCLTNRSAGVSRTWLHSSYIVSKRRAVFWVCEGPQTEELEPRFLIHPVHVDGKPQTLSSFQVAKSMNMSLPWSISFSGSHQQRWQ